MNARCTTPTRDFDARGWQAMLMRDLQSCCAIRDARYAMHDARCAMRYAPCTMRGASFAMCDSDAQCRRAMPTRNARCRIQHADMRR
jgi:hypothetical protein